MYRILNKQIFPTLRQNQMLTSVIAITNLRKTTPNYRRYIYIYIYIYIPIYMYIIYT